MPRGERITMYRCITWQLTKLRVIYVSVKLEVKARAAEQQGGEGELWCPV